MRPIDADVLKYRREEYGGYDDVSMEDRKRGILYILKEDIDNTPTIESKKGLWIKKEFPLPLSDGSKVAYECSCCKTHWDCESNYCPYCGAQMENTADDILD